MLSTEQNDIKNTLVTKASAAAVKQHGRSDFSKELIDYNIDIGDEKAVLRGFSDADSFKIIDSVACELISQRDLFSVFVFLTSMHDLIEVLYKSYNDNKMSPQLPPLPEGEKHENGGENADASPPQPNMQPSSLDAVGMPFAYDTGSRILCNVMFGDPFKQFETVEAAQSWLTSFMSTVKPVDSNIRNFEVVSRQWKDLRYEDDPDEVFRVFGIGGIMLQSPNIWSASTSRSFNNIVTGWNITDGKGGSLLPIMNLTGKGIDVPVVHVAPNQIISTPRWDIVGSNAVTALGAPANLQNLAIVPQSRYSEFTVTNTTTGTTENMFLTPGETLEGIFAAYGGFPASIHKHDGKIFALIVVEQGGRADLFTYGVMLNESYIFEGNVFVDKHNATIRKLTHEGRTYDIIKVDTNHWRLEPENVEFTELAAITLQNEIPTLQNPVVWRKHPDTGIWQEVHAQFNDVGEFTIANTSATHFSDWAINRSDIVFRVNGVDVIEADGIRDYPSDPLQYSVTVNDPSVAVIEVFEKQLNTDDYVIEHGQLIDDEDDPGSKRMSISYGFNQHKYDQYRADAEAPLRDNVHNGRGAYVSAYDAALRANPFTLLGDYADRVANNYRSTKNLIAYMQFLQYFVKNRMNVNEKTLKYIYDEVMQPHFVDYVQESIDSGLNDASVSLTSSYNIINNIGTTLDELVNITCDSQPTEPTPAKRESIRNEAVEYYTLLYPIRQIVHDKYVVIKDIFGEARRASYRSNPVETTRLAPYFQQNPQLLTNILTALNEIILITAEFVDTFVDKYTLSQTKNNYHGHLTYAGHDSMRDAIDDFLRSGDVNGDFARDTFESFNAVAREAAILDANPFFSIERRYEEERLSAAALSRGSILKIKAATKPVVIQAAIDAQVAAEAALHNAYKELELAEAAESKAAGLRGQLNWYSGDGAGDTTAVATLTLAGYTLSTPGAGDTNYAAAVIAQATAKADYDTARYAEGDAVEALRVICYAYQWLSPADIGVDASTLNTITTLVGNAETTWGNMQAIADVSLNHYEASQQATIEAKTINPTEEEAAIISSASEAVAIARAASDAALNRNWEAIAIDHDAFAIWSQLRTEESEAEFDAAHVITTQTHFIWEQAFNVLRAAEIARDAAIYATAGSTAVRQAEAAEAAALSDYELASWNANNSKKLYDTAKLRQQYATLFAAG